MATQRARESVGARELRAILAGHAAFAGLSDRVIESLARVAEREFVPAGRVLLAPGAPPDSAFVVEHGRLRGTEARVSDRAGHEVVLEFGRGDICALNLLVARLPTAGSVIALRDSIVLRLRGEALLRCVAKHPEMVTAQARHLFEVSLRTHARARYHPRILTLLPVGAVAPAEIDAVVRRLTSALAETLGPTTMAEPARLRELLGVQPGEGEPQLRRRVSEWCSREEERGQHVLLVCDRDETPWTRWCLEQTDRILVAARAGDGRAIDEVPRRFAGRTVAGAPVALDLLLVHDAGTDVPRGTGPWLAIEQRRRHHHLRLDRQADFLRAARRIGERAVGVVLGGGGARALAHIGVLQALDEAGVPVDAIGGTSMGAVVCAGYARGWSPRQMLELFAERVPDAGALRDVDFPAISLLAGRKLDRVLREAFGDLDLADLWVPCFSVSADLVGARMVVHDRGLLWQSVRASCSLPGIFPPVQRDGALLVDGGIVDNVPIDVMEREHAGATIIAIDVGAVGLGATSTAAPLPASGWRRLGDRLRGEPDGAHDVTIMHILTSSTMLGSKEQLHHLVEAGHADLFLVPPVKHIKLLGFDARQSLYDIGYEHTRQALARWSDLERVTRRPPGSGHAPDAHPRDHERPSAPT